MFKKPIKNVSRKARHLRVRKKITGTGVMPRLNVYRSNANIYAQIVDDIKGVTLVSASTIDKELKVEAGSNKDAAKLVGEAIAKRALAQGIENVVFDRGGYIFHGRVKELAEAARANGLKF